jgi:hypothetical protein
MTSGPAIDGVLVQWGERLFYPANRIVKPALTPRLDTTTRRKAAVIRQRIAATVVRRAPQVMVKVTDGGRGMAAIAAHFRYISKNGQLRIEDDRGVVRGGQEVVKDLAEQWRHSGSRIFEGTGAKPSTSCCRCPAAPTPSSCRKRRASSRRSSCAATVT